MELKTFFAQDTSGNILPGATVTVYQADTLTLVTGLQDEDGAALSNPFSATSGGKVAFYAPDGLYDILVVSGGLSVTIRSQFADVSNAATLGANTFTGAQTLPGNATANLHAVPKQQLDAGLATKAALAGSASQTFSVAEATSAAHAVRLGQFAAALSGGSLTLTVPCQGLPGGATELIVQIGVVSPAPDNSYTTVTLPIEFPNAGIAVFTTILRPSALMGENVMAAHGFMISNSQIGVGVAVNVNGLGSPDAQWMAIGY